MGDNLMIVGGTPDTTEPPCLDAMTYKGKILFYSTSFIALAVIFSVIRIPKTL